MRVSTEHACKYAVCAMREREKKTNRTTKIFTKEK